MGLALRFADDIQPFCFSCGFPRECCSKLVIRVCGGGTFAWGVGREEKKRGLS